MGLSCSASSLAPGRLGGLFSFLHSVYHLLTAREGTGVKLRILFHLLETGSRKEVFQPHLPVRLPCYDLAPVTSFALTRPSRLHALGTSGSHGLTGGVYKARERIHRAMADARLLANPASSSESSFMESSCRLQSVLGPVFGIRAPSPGGCPLYRPL